MFVDDKAPGEQQTKADPFILPSLIAWLEQQPYNVAYCYTAHGECFLAQYFTAQGFTGVWVVGRLNPEGAYIDTNKGRHPYPDEWDEVAAREPRTFGAALIRTRSLSR